MSSRCPPWRTDPRQFKQGKELRTGTGGETSRKRLKQFLRWSRIFQITGKHFLERPKFSRYEIAFIPDKPKTPPAPGRSVRHLRQSWQRLPSDLVPGREPPGDVDNIFQGNKEYRSQFCEGKIHLKPLSNFMNRVSLPECK